MLNSRILGLALLIAGLSSPFTPRIQAEPPKPAQHSIDTETQNQSLEILRKGFTSDEFWPSMHAAEALTLSGHGKEVLKALDGKLDQVTDLRHRAGLAREMVRAGDRSKVAVLQSVLANADPYGHVHACESLYKIREVGDAKLVQAAMNDSSMPVKALMAAAALSRSGDESGLKFIRSELSKQDLQSSWVAAWLLGVLGDQRDLPAIREGLAKAETPRNRAYFENALGLLGDAEGKKGLIKNLDSPEAGIRADAAYMVGDAGLFETVPRLKAMLKDADLDVRIRAAEGLLTLARKSTDKLSSTDTPKDADQATVAPTVTLDLPPGPGNSRNSEGSFIKTRDGRILFIYTYFGKGTGDDYDVAELRERVSTDGGKTWSGDGRTIVKPESGLNVMSVSLLRLKSGEIALFYAAKVSHSDCRPEMRISTDEGQTWGPAIKCITDEIDYYVINNDRVVQLESGRIVLPVCLHRTLAEKKNDWAGDLMCYLSDDNGKTWRRSKSVFKGFHAGGKRLTVQEPGVVQLKDGKVLMFIRSSSGTQMLSYSEDGCETWSAPKISGIMSPVSPASIKRIPKTGDLLLVWNDHSQIPPELKGKRTPLTVAVSKDEGLTWSKGKNIFTDPEGWFCYTAIEFVDDDVLLANCAGKRKTNGLADTKITRFNLKWLYSE